MIYLCRHGETEFNRQRRLQGHLDSELTARGREQAGAMASLLFDLISRDPPQNWRIFSSPQGRARATAAIIGARLGLPVITDDRLMEISVGSWEGRRAEDLNRESPGLTSELDWHGKAPGGEGYENLVNRLSAWLDEQRPLADQRLIVVSHGVAGRMVRGIYAGLPREAALGLDVPQDAIFRLDAGEVDRLDCAPISEASIAARPGGLV